MPLIRQSLTDSEHIQWLHVLYSLKNDLKTRVAMRQQESFEHGRPKHMCIFKKLKKVIRLTLLLDRD